MQQVRVGNLSLRVDEGNGKDERSALAYNFNQLLEHLENAFELQETFVINASHELRTPITSIIGEIEISLNKQRTIAEYEQVLLSILTDAERLKETITSLLELAHVDMNYTHPAFKPVAIDELIWELSDYWTARIGKGMFVVNVLKLPDENYITITIADLGIGIPADELEKVFESFYRGANVKNYMGNGIGLYVTNKIITLFNGTISVNSIPGEGTNIKITFLR
jgi:signal transduction histidine kinase